MAKKTATWTVAECYELARRQKAGEDLGYSDEFVATWLAAKKAADAAGDAPKTPAVVESAAAPKAPPKPKAEPEPKAEPAPPAAPAPAAQAEDKPAAPAAKK